MSVTAKLYSRSPMQGLLPALNSLEPPPLAFSSVEDFTKSPRRIMEKDDLDELVDAFAQGARRAGEAGFDGVQIHAAHGYLLSQSLSPALNKRNDAYGGSLKNRSRLLLEVLQAVRGAVGNDFPILVKLNSEDFLEGGLSLDDSVQVGEMLEKGGIDAIELSGGTFFSGKRNPSRIGIATEEKEAYFKEAAKTFKQKIRIPLDPRGWEPILSSGGATGSGRICGLYLHEPAFYPGARINQKMGIR